MDRSLTQLEQQLRRLHEGRMVSETVSDMLGYPIPFTEWSQNLKAQRGQELCPSHIATLMGFGVADAATIRTVVNAMEAEVSKRAERLLQFTRTDIVEAVIDTLCRLSMTNRTY